MLVDWSHKMLLSLGSSISITLLEKQLISPQMGLSILNLAFQGKDVIMNYKDEHVGMAESSFLNSSISDNCNILWNPAVFKSKLRALITQ